MTEFQFPTGWNSTVSSRKRLLRAQIVSIPNGMEFYFARSDYRKNRALVSIPNGMEFYRIPKKDDIFPFRFNSQRDGILLKIVKNILAKLHGFNSQRDGILRSQRRHKGDAYKLFQFPAGWNSTRR